MALLNFPSLSQEEKNLWCRALLGTVKNSNRLNLFEIIMKAEVSPECTFNIGIAAMSEENTQPEDIGEEADFRDLVFKDHPKTPASYNNEVLRFQAMGLPPGGGQGHDGWAQIHDVIYPLMARFQHDDGFILECTQLHGGIMWRLSSSNKVTLDQRQDLAVHEENIAKTWATRIIMQLQKFSQGKGANKDGQDGDDYEDTMGYQSRIHREGQSPVRADQWPKALLEKLLNTDMGSIKKRLLAEKGHTPHLMVAHDDQVDALKYGTTVHRAMEKQLRHAKAYGMGSKRLKQRAKVQKLMEKYKFAEEIKVPTPSRAGLPWGSTEDKDLKLAYQLGFGLARIAKFHGRTKLAIECRLEKLNLVKRYTGGIENMIIMDDIVDHKEPSVSHKIVDQYKVDSLIKDKHGAMAVLDIKTEESGPGLSAKGIREDELLDLKEERLTSLREGLDKPLPFKEAPVVDSDRSPNWFGFDMAPDTKDEPAPLQALTTNQFESNKTYIQVLSGAVQQFRSYYKGQLVSEDYLDELTEMQGKFYEVKEALPACGKLAKYIMLNGMVVEALCVQAVYQTPC